MILFDFHSLQVNEVLFYSSCPDAYTVVGRAAGQLAAGQKRERTHLTRVTAKDFIYLASRQIPNPGGFIERGARQLSVRQNQQIPNSV